MFPDTIEDGTCYMLRNDGALLECGIRHPYLGLGNSADRLFIYNWNMFVWFYNNTANEQTKEDLKLLLIEFCSVFRQNITPKFGAIIGKIDKTEFPRYTREELDALYKKCIEETNQEFCRVRTSALIAGKLNDGIYFRISSKDFNWFNFIWEVAYRYKNRVADVTVCYDKYPITTEVTYFSHNGKKMNRMPIDEFINLSGNPVIDNV